MPGSRGPGGAGIFRRRRSAAGLAGGETVTRPGYMKMKSRKCCPGLAVLLAFVLALVPLAVALAIWLTAGPVVDMRL